MRAYYLKEGGKGIFPLESWLNLPKRKYSYLLQKWMTLSGVRTTYEPAAQWDDIIEDFTIALDDGSLSRSKAHALKHKVLGSFLTNRGRMKYDEYLAAGIPIGSGVIEGTCKNLINDRMERSGMRWSPEGAEAMLKLRAVYLRDIWNDFWDFKTQREKKTLYGEQSTIPNQSAYQHDMANAA